jgi:predicted ester cyclase
MTRTEIETFFEARNHQWQARDAAGLAASHAERSSLDSPMFGHREGRAAIGLAYRQLFDIFPDWNYQGEPLLIDGDRVAQPFMVNATHVGMFLGHPGTNRQFRIQGVRLFTMADGMIQHERRLYDFTGLLIQIGVLKSKPA